VPTIHVVLTSVRTVQAHRVHDHMDPLTAMSPPLPVTTGSPRSRSLDVGPFRVVDAWFPPGLVLAPHLHDRSALVVILDGGFELRFARRGYECPSATVITEPIDDAHGNRFGRDGARVLVLQPDHDRDSALEPCAGLFDTVLKQRHDGIRALSWRLAHELRTGDTVSHLAVQGLGLELLAATARLNTPPGSVPPAWLDVVEQLLRDRFLDDVDLQGVADVVGVHPMHVARVFRRHHHISVGRFVRRLRLDWAVTQLASTDIPLIDLADLAGFADQSHFTRSFKDHVGIPPGRYRRETRDRSSPAFPDT